MTENYKNYQLFTSVSEFALVFCNEDLLQAMGLSERSIEILTSRIVHRKSFDEIGDSMQLIPQRVREICRISVRRLQRTVSAFLRNSISANVEIAAQKEIIHQLTSKLEGYRKELLEIENDTQNFRAVKLEDLGFTVRTYNALSRWTRLKTLRDLSKCSKHDLLVLRNFGKVCLQEVEEKLTEFGVVLS